MNNVCPYCNSLLDKIPTRKKSCPQCGKEIYVRDGKLLTKQQAVFNDAKGKLLSLGLKGLGAAQNIDDIWRILNEHLLSYSNKGDLEKLSSIYLQMAIICFDESRYKDCITNYLLCSHFSSLQQVRISQKLGIKLTFNDLMKVDNYMEASPVIKSILQININGIDSHNLGVLAINPKLTITQKLVILRDALNGHVEGLLSIQDSDYTIVADTQPTYDYLNNVNKNKSGCLTTFMIIFLVIIHL